MRRSTLVGGLTLSSLSALILPSTASAQDEPPTVESLSADLTARASELNTTWVMVAAVFVMFMQAGFLFLELGFTRGKNVGTMVAKILTNFSVAAIGWWAVGFAIAFGGVDKWIGDSGFLLGFGDTLSGSADAGIGFAGGLDLNEAGDEGLLNGYGSVFFFFQFVFCAVSLAIVWGTTLERIKFIVYPIYALVFSTVIYPVVAHWLFSGGFLVTEIGEGAQDYAGSTVVHLTGATGALAAVLLLGPRKGKYGPDGKPRAIPGHSMPLFGLGVLILWLGWFGFNPGSALGTLDNRFAEVAVVTNLAAAAGVIGAALTVFAKTRTLDVGMVGNGAIAALVGITAPSGYVEFWAAPIIGLVAGVIVVVAIYAIDKVIDDPVGALSAHGIAGIWGTLACGLFTSPRLAEYAGIGQQGWFYDLSDPGQLITQAVAVGAAFVFVFAMSFATFFLIKITVGLRVSEEDEDAGLDISEHGMYGYPEQFIPAPELVGYGAAPATRGASSVAATPTTQEVTSS